MYLILKSEHRLLQDHWGFFFNFYLDSVHLDLDVLLPFVLIPFG